MMIINVDETDGDGADCEYGSDEDEEEIGTCEGSEGRGGKI